MLGSLAASETPLGTSLAGIFVGLQHAWAWYSIRSNATAGNGPSTMEQIPWIPRHIPSRINPYEQSLK